MSTPKPWINTKSPRKDGKCAIYILVHLDYKSLKFNTGIGCSLNDWDDNTLRIKGSSKEVRDNNLIIDECLARMNDIFVRYRLQHIHLTPELLKNEWKNPARRIDFFKFYEEALAERKKELAPGSYRHHKSVIKIIKEFRNNLAFSEINPDLLVAFQRWLKTKRNCKINTVHSKMKVFRAYLNIAIRKGIISENPFERVKIKKAKTNRVFLTSHELQTLWNYYNGSEIKPAKQKVLRHFLFMCFTGVRISDLKSLTCENVIGDTLVFNAYKTKGVKLEVVRIPLNKYAKTLISNEKNNETRFLFNTISEQKMNTYIKEIVQEAGIDKEVTNHSGRHTFATLWLAKTRDLAQLQVLLGHSNISDTMTYVHIEASELHKRMKNFEKDIFPKKKKKNPPTSAGG
jgi:site-specific recombinase XerD